MKKQVIETIAEYMSQVSKSYPSIYSREDVMKLLLDISNDIEMFEEEKPKAKEIDFISLKDDIYEIEFENYCEADLDDAEFELDHRNTISLTSCGVYVNQDDLVYNIINTIKQNLNHEG